MNTPKSLILTTEHRRQLEKLVKSGMTLAIIIQRAKILLLKVDGRSNDSVADELGINKRIVLLWIQKYRNRSAMVDTFARIEITNLYFMLREMNSAAFSLFEPNTHYNLVMRMNAELLNRCRLAELPEEQKNDVYGVGDTDRLIRILVKEKYRKKISPNIWKKISKLYRIFRGKSGWCKVSMI